MNPVSAIGAIASVLGIGSSMVSQAVNIHRQLKPPEEQAQVQQQHCPVGFKLEVVLSADGQRQLLCVQEETK